MLLNSSQPWQHGIVLFLILLVSLTLHECAHAWVSHLLGDDTPMEQGRITLNPLAHIDWLGTVILPLGMILLSPGFVIFGWGKPVVTDPTQYKNPRWGQTLMSLAGPGANFALALVVSVVAGLVAPYFPKVVGLCVRVVVVNVALGLFNLLPVPPLDGSYILKALVGLSEETFLTMSRWGLLVLLLLINIPFVQQLFGALVWLLCALIGQLGLSGAAGWQ